MSALFVELISDIGALLTAVHVCTHEIKQALSKQLYEFFFCVADKYFAWGKTILPILLKRLSTLTCIVR